MSIYQKLILYLHRRFGKMHFLMELYLTGTAKP